MTAPTASAAPLVEMRNIQVAFGGVHAVDDVDRRPPRRRGRRPRRRQRRRQVDADARAVGRPSGRLAARSSSTASRSRSPTRATPRRWASRRSTRRWPWPTTSMRPANMFLGRELTTPHGVARRRRDGVRDPQGHGPAQPELQELQDAGEVAVRRPAPVGRDRAGGPLQRPDPDHGRADGRPRSGRDGPGPRPDQAAQGRGHRDLPDQPRHPRRLRPVRPDQRHVPRQARRHGQQGRRDDGRGPGHDHPRQEARARSPRRSWPHAGAARADGPSRSPARRPSSSAAERAAPGPDRARGRSREPRRSARRPGPAPRPASR